MLEKKIGPASVFWWAIILIHLLFFSIQLYNNQPMLSDSLEYVTMANNIKGDGNFYSGNLALPIDIKLYTKRTPFYPLLIAVVHSIPLLLIIQNLFSIFSIYLIREALILWGYNKKLDGLFLLLLILSPSQFIYANMVMSETLLQLMISGIIYLLTKYYLIKKSNWYLVLVNIFLILAVLTKPVILPFIGLNFLLMAYWSMKLRKWIPAFLSLGPIMAVLLYCTWNYNRTGSHQFSSIQTINLVDYNLYYFHSAMKGKEYANRTEDSLHQQAKKIGNYRDEMKFLDGSAIDIIKEHWFQYGLFHAKGVGTFFIDPGRFDLSNFFFQDERTSEGFLDKMNHPNKLKTLQLLIEKQSLTMLAFIVFITLANFVKLIGCIGFTFSNRIPIVCKILFLTFVLTIALATGPLGASRFMLPALLCYIGTAILYFSSIPARGNSKE